jgi:hypothetical protein
VVKNKARAMDRLQICMDALRVLARTNDPNRVVLIERQINDYLDAEIGGKERSLARLRKAIHDEATEGRQGEEWSIASDYVRSRLRGMT